MANTFPLCVQLVLLSVCYASSNISFQSLSIPLPTTLNYPIAVNYDDSLLILTPTITTYHSNTNTSLIHSDVNIYTLSSFTKQHLLQNIHNSTSHFTSHQVPLMYPPLYNSSLSCVNNDGLYVHCYLIIKDFLYIIPSPWNQYLFNSTSQTTTFVHSLHILIYDLKNNEFVPASTYKNHYSYESTGADNYAFIPVCIYSVDDDKIVIMGASRSGYTQTSYVYIISSNVWKRMVSVQPIYHTKRSCTKVNDHVYLFGGISNDIEVKFGEKCDAEPTSIFISGDLSINAMHCSYLDVFMKYSRSEFYVSLLLERYLLIYGGITQKARDHVEVFDTKTDTFVAIPIQFSSISYVMFTPLMLSNNILTIIGGKDSQNNASVKVIEYMILSGLFRVEPQLPQCLTTYKVDEYYIIDRYIFNDHEVNRLWFEVADNQGDGFAIKLLMMNEGWSRWLKFYRNNATLRVVQSNLPYFYISDHNLEDVYTMTGIDMTNDHYVFWVQLRPLFKIGLGYVFNQNELNIRSWKAVGFVSIEVKGGTFTFRTDSCSLQYERNDNNRFIVSDYVSLLSKWNLTQATSLDVSIYFTSKDIIDFNYEMTIDYDPDEKVSICTLCNIYTQNINETCYSCDETVPIKGLNTYDIMYNSYKIFITSEFENIYPRNSEIILHRWIQEIQFDVWIQQVFNDSNQTNDTFGIYPGTNIFIVPIYNKEILHQQHGNFIVTFDKDMGFIDNEAIMLIDFYHDICALMYDNITVNCYEESIVIPLSMKFKNTIYNEYNLQIYSSDTNITGQTFFTFSRYVQLLSIEFSKQIYLGEIIHVFINILDDDIYQRESSIIIENLEYGIYVNMIIKYDFYRNDFASCIMKTPNTGAITECNQGIQFISFSKKIIDDYIYLNISSHDTYIEQYQQKIYINQCNIGDELIGNNRTSFVCSHCKTGSVGLISNSQCYDCDRSEGISCMGSSNMIISYNYWINIDKNDNSIISSFCPTGYCCDDVNGCNYTEFVQSIFGICEYGRNPSTPLCGKCIDGYSESINNTKCIKCNESFYVQYLFYPLLLSMCIFLIIITINIEPIKVKQYPPLKPYSKVYFMLMIKHMILKNITYYEQGMAQILSEGTWTVLLQSVATIFNLTATLNNISGLSDDGWCFFDGLTAKQEILIDLIIPGIIIILFAFMLMISYFVPLKFRNKHINVKKAFLSTYTIIIGSILSVLFKLLNCQRIEEITVHFYFGEETCYGQTWTLSVLALVFIFISFATLFIKLWRMESIQRQSRQQSLNRIVNKYKPSYYYWEFVLFIRRVIVAVFAVSINDNALRFVFGVILLCFLFVHHKYQPFIIKEANDMEFILLCCLICTIILRLMNSVAIHHTFINAFISTLIILPYILFMFYIFQFATTTKKGKAQLVPDDEEYDEEDLESFNPGAQLVGSTVELQSIKHQENDRN